MNIVTWNMQGSNASTENKWNTGVMNILTSVPDTPIMCLQECGAVPLSAIPVITVYFHLGNGVVDRVDIYSWGGTSTRPGYYIFFHNWDNNGNRVNTAIVSKTLPADFLKDIVLMSPSTGPVWRPALGVNFQGTWVFSFHAISPGGPDGPGLLTDVSQFCNQNNSSWLVGADWNREPHQQVAPAGSVICPPNANTYSVSFPHAEYDYCVTSGANSVTGTVIDSVLLSDHFPVAFAF